MELSDIAATEYFTDASRRAAQNPHSVHGAPVSAYLDWVLTPGRFSQVVVPAGNRLWLQRLLRKPARLPNMISDLDAIIARQRDFLQLACAGFGLLIGSKETVGAVGSYLRGLGYVKVGTSRLNGGPHDPLMAAWNRRSLKAAVQLAFASPSRTVCIFGHDGDPAYLLHSAQDMSDPEVRLTENAG